MTQHHEPGSFQSVLGSVAAGDIVLLFKRFKLKLVAVAMNSQIETSCDEFLSGADLGGKGCYIPVEPLYVAPVDQDDQDESDEDDVMDGERSGPDKAVRFDESLSTIEQIRMAQASEVGLHLAHDELMSGRKNGDWGRWIFPTLAGTIVSGDRGRYRLSSPSDAVQILRDAELGPGYLKSVGLAWAQIINSGLSASQLMGSDAGADELRSSLEVFLEAAELLEAEGKSLPEMQQFVVRARQLLEFINPLL
jgi:uncharacterized protein (DUF1810 family)